MFSSNTSQVSSSAANYIEDVFSTWLYTGNGSTQTINNGIDLAGKGGMTWLKMRSPGAGSPSTQDHALFQTAAPDGSDQYLIPNSNSESFYRPTNGIDFTNSGFTLDAASYFGGSGDQSTSNFASWSFRKQAKFFDVVYFVGTGSARTVSHNLGSVPGCVIVKSNSTGNSANYDWAVYHQSLGNTRNLRLNTTAAQATSSTVWNNTSPTATEFTVGTSTLTNQNGVGYVALVFAHNAGGFGLTGTDNVISCGSYTGTNTLQSVNLGYEPQWVMIKNATTGGAAFYGWCMFDNMRGVPTGGDDNILLANNSAAENGEGSNPAFQYIDFTATGFNPQAGQNQTNRNGDTYIYIAIRRGPMRTPTSGTSVFAVNFGNNLTGAGTIINSSMPVDMFIQKGVPSGSETPSFVHDRLRGAPQYLQASGTNEELSVAAWRLDQNTGVGYATSRDLTSRIGWMFRRAPGFFDEVCWSGDDVAPRNITHNLTVAPEMMIAKNRTSAGTSWVVYHKNLTSALYILQLETTAAEQTASNVWRSTAPTASVFTVGNDSWINQSGNNYVNYLFATCPGVSKVGAYTGTGATQVINCGFTGGARFILIKATSTTGNWMLWDSARGIVAGNDPYLALNSTAAEVTNTDWVDTAASGFELSNNAGNLANSNGVSYIFLAIA